MKITASNVSMKGASLKTTYFRTTTKTLSNAEGRARSGEKKASLTASSATIKASSLNFRNKGSIVNLSAEGQKKLSAARQTKGVSGGDKNSAFVSMFEQFFFALTGKRLSLKMPQVESPDSGSQPPLTLPSFGGAGGAASTGEVYVERTVEQAFSGQMSFQAQAELHTSDGKVINVDLELNMSYEFYQKASVSVTAQRLCDPLVVNFNAPSAALTSDKYSFDLDCDGAVDQISRLAEGSGFLALDKNENGVIDDGSELFGAKSGDGFYDLSKYDEDGNGFIDENDSVYESLRIWTTDRDGNSKLLALGEVGIGAIYTGSVDTAFDLRGESDALNGVLRKTGFFVRENGTAGTVQHIDMAI
ncbi:hypothetical protein LJC34_02350 [Oscillospiraceae bacterium OttesenSCG-928-G22]|nr:hypothetical protein [Oscillospiraceae bacterium OttesenSCG-928-G22]